MTDAPDCLLLDARDSVAVALRAIAPGDALTGAASGLCALDPIPSGHKIAVTAIEPGAAVRKFGQTIGYASEPILPGQHVHVRNLRMAAPAAAHHVGSAYQPTQVACTRSFDGILRSNGRAATRNYIGILSSVNCSATVCRMIADKLRAELADYPHVDGVVAITHDSGCGLDSGGEGFAFLRRVMLGYADHANFAGVLLVGLGCEMNQLAPLVHALSPRAPALLAALNIQEVGGTQAAIDAGLAAVRAMLPLANQAVRVPVPLSQLTVGLQCGGSDGYSGISANPALGVAVDLLVAQGGTAILSETPEIYGADHLLTARAASAELAERLIERIRWWESYTARHGGDMNNNPSPGNKAGGITTILEKSLGAVAKGGTTGLMAVHSYGEAVAGPGLVFMDTPGYDPVSATGQVAGGANLICFTTGRGSTFGCKPTPSLKIASNTRLFERMALDMDFNAGLILDGRQSVEEAGAALLALMIETASGRKTCSEHHGLGDNEFVPWQIGAVM